MDARWVGMAVLALACAGAGAMENEEPLPMPDFELVLNIDFHDVLNVNGKGHSPGVGESDHYPVELLERMIGLVYDLFCNDDS